MATGLLQRGQAWLASQLGKADPTTVTYWRGNLSAALVPMVLGQQLLRVSDGKGNTKLVRTELDGLFTDWSVPAAAGVTLPPLEGDLVHVTFPDGATEQFEVTPIGGEPHWRWSDPYHIVARVHLKHRKTLEGVPTFPEDGV